MSDIFNQFNELLDNLGPYEASPQLAVAVSGGSDSMALLLLAHNWAQNRGAEIVALTVDHGLRPESRKEAEQVGEWLRGKGIKHHILAWLYDVKPIGNLQAKARAARYELLTSWCKSRNILHLLVAHHMDDQAETVLLRLERGSSVDGLAAMSQVSYQNHIRILRPLLSISKSQLVKFLQERHQQWIEDPSNQNQNFARVRVRESLANNNLLTTRLAATAVHMTRVKESLELSTANFMAGCICVYQAGYAELNVQSFKVIPAEEALRILSKILLSIGGADYKPRFEALELLYHAIQSGELKTNKTLGSCKLIPKKGKLLIIKERPVKLLPLMLSYSEIMWDNRFLIHCDQKIVEKKLTIGYPENSIFCNAAINDILGEELMPKEVLLTIPVIKALDNVIAIPHIGYYLDSDMQGKINIQFQPKFALN